MDEEINNTPEQIQESNVEQITKEPTAPLKIKDPKRVEAGKKLAEYNRKAKAKQKQNQQKNEEIETPDSTSWVPNINLTSVIGIISLGLTAVV